MEGLFYNYFSVGLDARAAYGFHHLRETRPWAAPSRLINQAWYAYFSCASGWFCCAPPLNTTATLKVRPSVAVSVLGIHLSDACVWPVPVSLLSDCLPVASAVINDCRSPHLSPLQQACSHLWVCLLPATGLPSHCMPVSHVFYQANTSLLRNITALNPKQLVS